MRYAYSVMVGGKKRYGGTISADSMDQAAQKIADKYNITRQYDDSDRIWSHLYLDGKKADILIYANTNSFKINT